MDSTFALSIEGRVRRYTERRLPAMVGSPCVIAASGGGDSTALAGILMHAGLLDAGRTIIAHFDHRLRTREQAAAEREAVAALARRFGVRMVEGAWERPRAGEAAAREARYHFLCDVANGAGAAAIVTGHTLDDQAETVLLRALRGAGVHGLAGMRADASAPYADAVRVWRPLLALTREETRAYCCERGLLFRDDPSNEDRALLRNRVRHEVLAPSEARAPGLRAALARLADASSDLADRLDRVASGALPFDGAVGELSIRREALRSLPAPLRPYAMRLAVRALLGDAREFDASHYARLASAADARTGACLQFPRGLTVTVEAGDLVLAVGAPRTGEIDAGVEHSLPYSGCAGRWIIDVRPAGSDEPVGFVAPAEAVVRGRRPGDRVRPRGLRGSRKLQDYYVDRKVPRRLRDAAPVIAAGSEVLWTPFFGAVSPGGSGVPYAVRARRLDGGTTSVEGRRRPTWKLDVAGGESV